MTTQNSFGAAGELRAGGRTYQIFRLSALEKAGFDLTRIPFSIKILLENLLRFEDGSTVKRSDIEYVAKWDTKADAQEINFRPARVVLQDFTGVPCVVDLAAMRDALAKLGADPKKANPLVPVDLVIDHSVQVDHFGTTDAFRSERAARIPAQSGALCVPALGPVRVSRISAPCRRIRASCIR